MAANSYPEAIRRLLLSEGGYVNHPSDPGGPTNFGVTLADYRKYAKPGATAADVRAMKVSEAKAIYKPKYWDKIAGDALPAGLDYCLFDYAVNSGTGRAPKVLQRVLGIKVSGRIDTATLQAVAARDAKKLIAAVCDERLRFLKSLKTWPVFGAGWGRRVAEVRAAALAMASLTAAPVGFMQAPSIVPVPDDPSPSVGKGMVAEPTAALASVSKGGPGGMLALLLAARDWALENPFDAALIGVAASILIVGAVHLLRAWHQRQQEAPVPAVLVTA